MAKNTKKMAGFAAVAATLLAMVPAPVLAQVTIVPECARIKTTYGQVVPVPQLSCLLEMFGNVGLLILGITGSIALLMFVYGGFMVVISSGDSGKVQAGRKIITNAVIGIAIIMSSGIILNYALTQLKIDNNFKIIGQTCGEGKVFVMKPDGKITCETPQTIK